MKAKKMMLMGGKRSLFLLMTLLLTLQDVTADVIINSTNFPDENFRSYLISEFSKYITQGNVLTQSGINSIKEIDVHNKNIVRLDGIKYFTELQTLRCSYNKLKYLDLYYNTKLTGVECDYNQLEQLSVRSKNLQWLGCSNNNLEAIGFDDGTYSYLKQLFCSDNPIMTHVGVPFSQLPALEKFDCSGTKFSGTLNLSSCSNLEELTCENITTLQYLNCYGTALKTLSVSGCSNLKELECDNNKLTSLNVWGCSSLYLLNCEKNQLTIIANMDGCKSSLKELYISFNKFTSLNLSGYNKLQKLHCYGNQLTSFNLSGCNNLEYLDCGNNRLSTLTLNGFEKLASVTCSNNSLLTSLDVSNNALTSLYLTGCSNLTRLNCNENQLYSLDLSTCENLGVLNCWDNKLEYLDLSNNKNIYLLDCSCNPISSLNIKGYTNLSSLYCHSCRIASLDLSGCNKLGILYCYRNQLTSLILPKESTELNYVECYQNKLEGNMMDAFVASLPNRKYLTSGEIRMMIDSNLAAEGNYEGNVCTPQNVRDAKMKKWNTYCLSALYDWYLYLFPGISTDIRTAETNVDGDAPRYNMSGQRVGRDYKGIIIMNGKRVVIK